MKFILLIFTVFSFLNLNAQTDESRERVNEAFGEEYAQKLASSNPGKFKMLNKYAETGFIVLNGDIKSKNVVEINTIPLRKKGETLQIDEFIQILKNESYNPLSFEWIPGTFPRIYKLAATDYFICVPSQKQLERI